MIHITMNTGHSVVQDLTQIPKGITDQLAPLLRSGGQLPGPFSAFRVELSREPGASVFTIYRGQEPLATCGLVSDPERSVEVWEELERLYLELGDALTASGFNAAPEMPQSVPWLAVILMPHIANQSRNDLGWLGDFERCFAAAILRDR